MTKFLRVYDDGDFGAGYFEKQYDINDVAMQMIKDGVTEIELPNKEFEDDEDVVITVELHSFGDVDSDFVSFLRTYFLDYDALKAEGLYEVTI